MNKYVYEALPARCQCQPAILRFMITIFISIFNIHTVNWIQCYTQWENKIKRIQFFNCSNCRSDYNNTNINFGSLTVLNDRIFLFCNLSKLIDREQYFYCFKLNSDTLGMYVGIRQSFKKKIHRLPWWNNCILLNEHWWPEIFIAIPF